MEIKSKDNIDFLIYDMNLFLQDMNTLRHDISSSSEKFTIILAIAKGGIPAASFLSNQLDIPLQSIQIKSSENLTQTKLEIITEPNWFEIKDKTVLVINDIFKNRDEMEYIIDLLTRYRIPKFKICSLINNEEICDIKPDFFARETKKSVTFFWDAGYYNKGRM